MFDTRQFRIDRLLLRVLLLDVYTLVQGGVAPLMTPAPVVRENDDIHRALRRQLTTTSLVDVCGYVDAAVLQPRGCPEGFTCYVESSLSVAGGCCRLGDAANCQLPTACVAQADRTSSCDSSCSANERITKCDLASPYCYTNYWPTSGQTFSEVGCTTAQGQLEYIYSTYTGFGAEITDLIDGAQATGSITNIGTGGSEQTGSSSPSGTSVGAGNNGNSGSGGSSTNTGAIAGGVVGGVAVLGLVAALITWIVLRNRRKERAATAAARGTGGGHGKDDSNNELKPPQENIAAVSPTSSHAVPRKPVGQDLHAGPETHEPLGKDIQIAIAQMCSATQLQCQTCNGRRVNVFPCDKHGKHTPIMPKRCRDNLKIAPEHKIKVEKSCQCPGGKEY
ncbi:hypothetical protein BST61_g1776 [Cercospora zeina]